MNDLKISSIDQIIYLRWSLKNYAQNAQNNIYIYIVIHRQTVSFYQNSSVWLDTQDARSRDRNPSNFTLDYVSDRSTTKRTTLAKGIFKVSMIATAAASVCFIIIQDKRTRHAVHCWRSKDRHKRVLTWGPTKGRAKVGQPERTYLHQLCADIGCNMPGAMDDRDGWSEKGSGNSALSAQLDEDDDINRVEKGSR